jgi:hypothetical protein
LSSEARQALSRPAGAVADAAVARKMPRSIVERRRSARPVTRISSDLWSLITIRSPVLIPVLSVLMVV